MSRNGRYGAWLAVAAIVSLAGCCGGGSTHKCDFSGYEMDAGGGMDASMGCGNLTCDPGKVCCVTKVFPFVSCVAPSDFMAQGCMQPPDKSPPCLTPHDCDAGAVCCLYLNPRALSCLAPSACPGDGVNTFVTCMADVDCPRVTPGVCQNVSAGAGLTLNVCQP